MIEVDTGDAPALDWGDPEAAGIGTPVFALANPGGRGLRVTFGTVSSANRSFRGPRGRRIQGAIEHTAALPRGSSGGPLVDGDGRLLGVNSIRLDGDLILALAADATAHGKVDRLAAGEEVERPASASRSRRPTWRAGCAARWACPTGPACSCAASRTLRPPTGPASSAATSSSRRRASRSRASTTSTRASTPPATASPSRRCGGPRKRERTLSFDA